jgi:hypothetical protein
LCDVAKAQWEKQPRREREREKGGGRRWKIGRLHVTNDEKNDYEETPVRAAAAVGVTPLSPLLSNLLDKKGRALR